MESAMVVAPGETDKLSLCIIGSATSAHVLARVQAFAERGHKVTFLSTTPVDLKNVRVVVPSMPENMPNLLRKLAFLFNSWRLLRRTKANIYHVHYVAEIGAWAAMLARKRPLVATVMGGDVLFDEQGSQRSLGRWLTKNVLKACDLVTVKSTHLGQVVSSFGVPRERIETVIWGVQAARFRVAENEVERFRAELGLTHDNRMILSPRPLGRFYNHHLLIECLVGLKDCGLNCNLVLLDYNPDPGYRDELIRTANRLGVEDKIHILPAQRASTLPTIYAAADVMMSLPESDGFPQSVLESMAAGTPVVMTDLERFHDLLTHRKQVMFTALKPDEILENIRQTLSDKILSETLSSESRTFISQQADFDENVDRVERHYYRLAGALKAPDHPSPQHIGAQDR